MNEKSKNKIASYIYIIILFLLIFQNFLQMYITIFQYYDEILAVIGILAIIFEFIKSKGKIKKSNLIILSCMIVISIIGFYAVIENKYQELQYAVIDWILVTKFFLIYLLSQIYTKHFDLTEYSNKIYKSIKVTIIILSIFTVANYVFKLYPSEVRYGIMANKLFYGHPTYLAAVCIALIANMMLFSKKTNKFYMFLCLIILASTMRVKAIAATVIILIIIIYVNKTNKKISMSKLGIVGLVAIIVAWSQIEYYFLDYEGSPRRLMIEASINIANENFPIGTGFGTFGSFVSGEHYSPLYEMYGLNKIFGLKEGETFFLSDNFWPMIIGQFGYIGTIIYLLAILMIFLKMQGDFDKNNKNIYLAKITCLAYLLISSIAEASFANPIAIPLAIILGMNYRKNKNNKQYLLF